MEKLNELREKAREFLEAIDTICKDYEKKQPEFKVGDWAKTKFNNKPFRITEISETGLISGEDYSGGSVGNWHPRNLLHCTEEEIKSHLKKICDEKYIGKKVKCLSIEEEGVIVEKPHPDPYACHINDSYWMLRINKYGTDIGMCVYRQGHFAEIIPDKKKKPETRKEFKEFLRDFYDSLPEDTMGISSNDFLNQYEID